jgi:hypothetical protein
VIVKYHRLKEFQGGASHVGFCRVLTILRQTLFLQLVLLGFFPVRSTCDLRMTRQKALP